MFKRLCVFCFSMYLFLPIAVLAADELYVGGDSVGIEVSYDGVMVTGTYSIQIDNELYDPITGNIQSGDIIQAVNGHKITTMKELYAEVSQFQEPINEVPIVILRDNKQLSITLKTLYNEQDHTFQSGLYVKDKISGVGTMTFYDPETHSFGALGHEIMDTDLKKIADITSGTIYSSSVSSITKAQKNIAGEKHAAIDYTDPLGTITSNTPIGIYGHYDEINKDALRLPWAKQEEIHTGYAQIYTVLSGSDIQAYDIDITKLHAQSSSDVKGIEFTISDPILLESTNGVIQGMSGSPIVQDGKIIGAITHVITAEPTTGYGVYIEWMLEQANQQ